MAKFDWFKRIGATDEAVAVLNDQPFLFTNLILVILGLMAQAGLIWYIHYATLKPEQKKKKTAPGAKGSATAVSGLKAFSLRRRNNDNARGGPGRNENADRQIAKSTRQ